VQRLRFRFRITPSAAHLGHRDIVHIWSEALTAGGFPVALSQGKRPSHRIALAAPLPQNATSDWELVDIYFDESITPARTLSAARDNLPQGIEALDVQEVGPAAPSLQSQVRWAEYQVDIPAKDIPPDDVRSAVKKLLSSASCPAEYRREARVKRYDLRPLVLDLALASSGDCHRLRMRLRAEPELTARADQVAAALGLPPPVGVHRVRLQVAETPAVLLAHRRAGAPEGSDGL
jgi:radical SAM-linked protein